MYAYGSGLGFLECVFVGCTVLMLLHVQLVWAPVAVNIHYFVWELLSAIYKFSFIHTICCLPSLISISTTAFFPQDLSHSLSLRFLCLAWFSLPTKGSTRIFFFSLVFCLSVCLFCVCGFVFRNCGYNSTFGVRKRDL